MTTMLLLLFQYSVTYSLPQHQPDKARDQRPPPLVPASCVPGAPVARVSRWLPFPASIVNCAVDPSPWTACFDAIPILGLCGSSASGTLAGDEQARPPRPCHLTCDGFARWPVEGFSLSSVYKSKLLSKLVQCPEQCAVLVAWYCKVDNWRLGRQPQVSAQTYKSLRGKSSHFSWTEIGGFIGGKIRKKDMDGEESGSISLFAANLGLSCWLRPRHRQYVLSMQLAQP